MNTPRLVDKIGGFTVVPNRFIDEADVSHESFRVFVQLRRLVNVERGDETAWPRYETLMKSSRIASRRTLAQALRDLVESGWLVKERRFSKSTRYILTFPALSSSPVETTERRASSSPVETISSSPVDTATSSPVDTLTRETEQEKVEQERGGALKRARPSARSYEEIIPFSDEAIERAGRTGKSPRAIRAQIAKEARFELGDAIESELAIFAHRQICGYVPLSASVAHEIVKAVGDRLEDWRSTLLGWMAAGWNSRNVEGQLQRFESEAKRAEARKTIEAKRGASAPAYRSKTVTNPQVADPTEAERAASEERARLQRAQRAEERAARQRASIDAQTKGW